VLTVSLSCRQTENEEEGSSETVRGREMSTLEDKIRKVMEMDVSPLTPPEPDVVMEVDDDQENGLSRKQSQHSTENEERDESSTSSPASRSSKSFKKVVGSKLYERAMAQRAAKEERRQDAIRREATFSPKLVSSERLRRRATIDGKERFDTLYEDAATRKLNLENRQSQALKAEEYSFSPKTNDNKRSNKEPSSPTKRSLCLFEQAKVIEAKKKQMAEEALRREAEEFSFKPKITEKAKQNATPGHQRIEELYESAREKTLKIAAEQQRRELEGCTFQPNINRREKKSTGMGTTPPQASSVQDRLAKHHREAERRRNQLKKRLEDDEKKEMTFSPKIQKRPRNSPKRAPGQRAIHERLYSEAKRRQEKEDSASPSSGKKRRPKSPVSPAVFERLSTPKKPLSKEQLDEEQLLQELKECTFKPNLSVSSAQQKVRISSKPCWERLHNESRGVKAKREELRRKQELDGCTFQPKVEKQQKYASKQVTPVWERLGEKAKLSQQKLEEMKARRDQLELEKCTFRPQVKAKQYIGPKTVWERLAGRESKRRIDTTEKQQNDAKHSPKSAPVLGNELKNTSVSPKST